MAIIFSSKGEWGENSNRQGIKMALHTDLEDSGKNIQYAVGFVVLQKS